MKAALQHKFGPPEVIAVDELPAPTPADDEVLVRVHASVLGVVDSLARRGSPAYARIHFGLRKPRFAVLGCDFAGTVAAVGPAVTRFAVGDEVFGTIAPRFGAHAEYVCLSEQADRAQAGRPVLRRGGRAGRRHRAVL